MGPRMSDACGRHCEGCLWRSKPKREGIPWWRRTRRSRGDPQLVELCLCRCPSRWRSGPCGQGSCRAKVPRKKNGSRPPVRMPGGRHVLRSCRPPRWMWRWCGSSKGRRGSRAGMEGAGRCHLGGGEGGHWPANAGPSGGLGRALLGGWVEPATRSCGFPAASGGGNLASPPTLTIRPSPSIPFDTRVWPFAGCRHCGGLAAHGCPSSHPMSCWAMPAGEPAKQPEAPEPW